MCLQVFPLTTLITFELCHELMNPEDTTRWCQVIKFLPSVKNCTGRGMHLVKRKGSPEEKGWICSQKGCRKEATLRGVTFIEGKTHGGLNLAS